jgi:mycothiol synthase
VTGVGPLRPARDVQATPTLTADAVAAVLALAETANDADGVPPLSEHVRLHVRHGGDPSDRHLLVHVGNTSTSPETSTSAGAELVGYAHVDSTDPVDGPSAELVVHPLHRRAGIGRALVLQALAVAAERDPQRRLRLWAHGDHPSATALALALGFDRTRVLWQMLRSLTAQSPVPAPELPPGVRLRAFRPGADEAAWLAVNARAFAHHPEQGRWTAADLATRMAEDWFDPAGFLLAESVDGTLLGFHWTKVHGQLMKPSAPAGGVHQHSPIGEVYVVGVDPAGHGQGLGTALTLAGLAYLRDRGLEQVMLYVDEDNTTAARLYQRLGFARWATDVCYRFDGTQPAAVR